MANYHPDGWSIISKAGMRKQLKLMCELMPMIHSWFKDEAGQHILLEMRFLGYVANNVLTNKIQRLWHYCESP